MKILGSLPLAVVLVIFLLSSAEAGIQKKQVQFVQGLSQTEIKGRIKGRETIDYILRAHSGQLLSVAFKSGNSSAYFNVLPPGSESALFVGSTSGNSFSARLGAEGIYTIRVYLMRNAARRNEVAGYSLKVSISDGEATSAQPFNKTLTLQGVTFTVSGENNHSENRVRIVPSGLEINNTPIERVVNGVIMGAEVADLNADGSPEIYVYISSAGSGTYGSLIAYSANNRKSLSEIYLPPLTDDKILSIGYMGHDEFSVLEGVLGRRFPVYRDGDSNATPTGGVRQIQYRLTPGEATWRLVVDKVLNY